MEHLDVQLAHQLIRGHLDPAASQRWQRHLEQCARCREIVAAERALLAVLGLASDASPPVAPAVDHIVDQVPRLSAGSAQRHRSAVIVGELLVLALLAGMLIWQTGRPTRGPDSLAAELRIAPELQTSVVQELSALAALRADPWLIDEYDAVETLQQLIAVRNP